MSDHVSVGDQLLFNMVRADPEEAEVIQASDWLTVIITLASYWPGGIQVAGSAHLEGDQARPGGGERELYNFYNFTTF